MTLKQNIRLKACRLERFAKEALLRVGVQEEDARNVAHCLVEADRRGIDSHGVTRLPIYMERKRQGLIAPVTKVDVLREYPATSVMDANNGWGATAGLTAMEWVIDRARTQGVASAVVRRSNHFGMAAFYALRAVEQGMIGLALTNASPSISPWGGKAKYLGTNPICVAVPSSGRWPLVYDGATSQVARGKLQMALQRGETLESNWAIDVQGETTTDPLQGLEGSLLPLGGYKGSGLAMIVEVLTGVLAKGSFGSAVGQLLQPAGFQDVSHFFAAMPVEAFMPQHEFLARVEELQDQVRALPPREGQEILLPGEPEFIQLQKTDREGIPLSADVWAQLQEISDTYGIKMPQHIRF